MLDIKYYVLIDAVERHGSLQAASAAIGLTQPAATHRIREMERRLAVSLFEKRGRRLFLTPAGKRLLEAGREIIPILMEAESEASLLSRRDTQALRWGVDAHDIVDSILSASLEQNLPPIELYRFSTHTILGALLDQQIDLMLTTNPPVQKGIETVCLFEDELKAVVPATHPLACRNVVSAEEISREPYLTFSAAREPGYEFDLFFHPERQAPESIQIIESVRTILDVIATTQRGVSILSSWIVDATQAQQKLKALPLNGVKIPVTWYLAYLNKENVQEQLPELKTVFQNAMKSA
ncbi:LysR family transcriptional regulator [Halomonas sp. HMF6819]|uniref:LysR family transcriptional regulator n=1 Tax=Halomonas sp. HMF6819 TaxID=3373085 RepID=UPI0037AFF6EA